MLFGKTIPYNFNFVLALVNYINAFQKVPRKLI